MFSFYWLGWQRALDFSGRSTRAECWWFMLGHLLVTLICIWLDVLLANLGWLDLSYGLVSSVPLISLIVRRLHDTGRSGWWGWVFLVPAVGPLLLIYLLAQQSGATHVGQEASA
ncbi:DUF805 domain-containing protein [Aeromonas hydrophila]|uniref:DUF805 domain-containing protein n=1 Tax=Aeromonas hydrophila TaxID=644 RepID=UPI0005F071DE|nr:DUF805 domain-containing protein [Aeromonas hydrophila]QPR87292.1 DUF805 domain-containing protein [Aeromonas hydrophila]UON52397.1 DUF805 domain-containing protein [Aeromonas hydrophila]